MLLIFTHRRGFEADAVIDALRGRGHPLFRFNADDPQARIAVFPDDPARSWIECDGRRASLAELSAGWFQQDLPNPILDDRVRPAERLAWLNRSAALEFILAREGLVWLSRPANVRSASNKPRQLSVASRHGLAIPATAVTDSLTVAQGIDRGRGSIVKNLATPWLLGPTGVALAYTREFDGGQVTDDQVAFAPLIYQERIQRRRDIRVVVVGGETFAAAIDLGETADIRAIPLEDADYRACDLPGDTEKMLLRVCSDLGIEYASIDLVEEADGELKFLEINTTGAFLWLERICRFPITATITDRLIGLSP